MYRCCRKGYLAVSSLISRKVWATLPLFWRSQGNLKKTSCLKADMRVSWNSHTELFFFQSVLLVMVAHMIALVGRVGLMMPLIVKMVTVFAGIQNILRMIRTRVLKYVIPLVRVSNIYMLSATVAKQVILVMYTVFHLHKFSSWMFICLWEQVSPWNFVRLLVRVSNCRISVY